MSIRLSWIHSLALACAVAIVLLCLSAAPPAHGATFGELGQLGGFGEEPGQLDYPSALAVDPSDNSVYVLDEPGAIQRGAGPTSFRIQKFSADLGTTPEASVMVTPTPVAGHKQVVDDIAVDAELHRLYVLVAVESERSIGNAQYMAEQIDAYSTITMTPGETLQPAPGVQFDSKAGVFYEFPAVPNAPEPAPAGTVAGPSGLAVDTKTHDLLVLGRDEQEDPLIQQIATTGPSYADGVSGESFDDTNHELTKVSALASGIAVGPEGEVSVSSEKLASGGRGVVELSIEAPNSLAKPVISTLASNAFGEPNALTGGLEGNGKKDSGAQVSVAPEGGLVYAMQESKEQVTSSNEEGSYEIRGMEADSGAQKVVFGGGASPKCHIASLANAVGAGSGGVVYALDEGETVYNETSEEYEPSSYGFHLIKFGPEGSGCPTPSASFTIDGKPAGSTITVRKGETVDFDASGSELHGEKPTEVEWDLDGSGKYATVLDGSAGLETSMRYLTPGRYTIGLKILLANGGSYGDPPPVTGTLVVEATPPTAGFEIFPSANLGEALKPGQEIEPEEAVTFNGAESVDPTGSPTGTPTHMLKSYTWSFGDGKTETTTAHEYTRSFANATSEARVETVSLTVIDEEGTNSPSPATQTITIQAAHAKEPVKELAKEPIKEAAKGPAKEPVKEIAKAPVKKPLTTEQKLAAALKACKKDKSRKARASCEKGAHTRYGPKPKKHSNPKHKK